jgi:hypothetical protein
MTGNAIPGIKVLYPVGISGIRELGPGVGVSCDLEFLAMTADTGLLDHFAATEGAAMTFLAGDTDLVMPAADLVRHIQFVILE